MSALGAGNGVFISFGISEITISAENVPATNVFIICARVGSLVQGLVNFCDLLLVGIDMVVRSKSTAPAELRLVSVFQSKL